MNRKFTVIAFASLGGALLAAARAGGAWAQAQTPVSPMARAQAGSGVSSDIMIGPFFTELSARLDHTVEHIPKLGRYLLDLPGQFDLRTTLLLLGIVVAGLAAEFIVRQFLRRIRHGIFAQHASDSPLRAFVQGAFLDALALLALWIAARLVAGQVGDAASVRGKVAGQVLLALTYWRSLNFIFRIWLHPSTAEGRIAPVDDATARRLLVGMNVIILLPTLARHIVMFLDVTGAGSNVVAATVILYVPVFGACLVYSVWHWRHDMAAWLAGMVAEKDIFRSIKLKAARDWWIAGIVFYVLSALAAIYAAVTEHEATMQGLAALESMLLLLLLLETVIHRRSQRFPTEVPTAGEVVAACLRLAVRLVVIVVAARAVLVDALGLLTPQEWGPHEASIKLAAVSAFAAYALWAIVKYRMDRYIADNPLPTAAFGGKTADNPDGDNAPNSASRLRTVMPVLRMTVGGAILILSTLLVLSELGVNITPLIAGASVLGLAVSFGSQSLVRDIVSGVFFLAEDSFRVGEYIDGSKVKGTVEGFSIRSIRLRHQNGPLHIVPFGQLTHITNFSRDWTTMKFNLAFSINTDVELLRKTVKKIGLEMMNEPEFAKDLLAPLKMQGIVDIKDASLIVRFKFTALPTNPSLIQRTAIRRMFEALPKLGIEFARPPFAPYGFGGVAVPPQAQAAQ